MSSVALDRYLTCFSSSIYNNIRNVILANMSGPQYNRSLGSFILYQYNEKGLVLYCKQDIGPMWYISLDFLI